MKKQKNLHSSQSLGTFPSLGTGGGGGAASGPPNYQDKGWSSERIPRPSGNSRRHISALTPFCSGRTLPSKWEDAERWICSPILSYGNVVNNSSSQSHHQRRPKSKSGPIVPPPFAYYSPSVHGLDHHGASIKNFMLNSPFSTGVLMPNGVGFHYSGAGGEQGNVTRSTSVPGWSDLVSDSSLPSSPGQDEKVDDINGAESPVNDAISRRDMATQMTPESTCDSSPTGRSSSPPSLPLVESDHPTKLEIREVQVDKGVTVVSGSKRRVPDVEEFDHNPMQIRSSSWDISDRTVSDISKMQREEAKIVAWENLQKAKAEASIRRLEMKLEKKRSASMDKILNKLRTAEMKAQEMRNSISDEQDYRAPKISHKISFLHKHFRLSSLTSCFMRHSY